MMRFWPRTKKPEDFVLDHKFMTASEIKAEGRDVIGYASTFEVDSAGDRVLPGAFAVSLKQRRPAMLYQHQMDQVLGRWTEFTEDSKGLRVVGKLSDTAAARDVATLINDGALSSLSIGYRTKRAHMNEGVRELAEVDLYEISFVTVPANPGARLDGAKALAEADQGELAALFAEAGRVLGLPATIAAKASAAAADAALAAAAPHDPAADDLLKALRARIKED